MAESIQLEHNLPALSQLCCHSERPMESPLPKQNAPLIANGSGSVEVPLPYLLRLTLFSAIPEQILLTS